MTINKEQNHPPNSFPSIDLAYSLVQPSYELARQRLDAVDGRLQFMTAFCASTLVAVPTVTISISQSGKPDFTNWFFWMGMAVIFLAMLMGVVARAWAGLQVMNPSVLHDKWLGFEPPEFKKKAVYWAGQHFENNVKAIDRKGKWLTFMSALYASGMASVAFWIIIGFNSLPKVFP